MYMPYMHEENEGVTRIKLWCPVLHGLINLISLIY